MRTDAGKARSCVKDTVTFTLPQAADLLAARAELAGLDGFAEAVPQADEVLRVLPMGEALACLRPDGWTCTLEDVLRARLRPAREQGIPESVVWRLGELLRAASEVEPRTRACPEALRKAAGMWLDDLDAGLEVRRLLEQGLAPFPGLGNASDPLVHSLETASVWLAEGAGQVGGLAVARLLLQLRLAQTGLLRKPVLFLGGWLCTYPRTWAGASTDSAGLLLSAVRAQSLKSRQLLRRLGDLYVQTETRLQERVPRLCGRPLLGLLFAYPALSPVRLGELLGVHYTTASRHLRLLERHGFLEARPEGKYRAYVFADLLHRLEHVPSREDQPA